MARPSRVLVAGGWYHVVNRGNPRERTFCTEDGRRRFPGQVLYVAVRQARHGLSEVHGRIPGLKYQAAAQAVKRFAARRERDPAYDRFVRRLAERRSRVQNPEWGHICAVEVGEACGMARPLRVLVPGGWYHVVDRGNRRERIFRTDDDRRRFLGRLAGLPRRFRVGIHAFSS